MKTRRYLRNRSFIIENDACNINRTQMCLLRLVYLKIRKLN